MFICTETLRNSNRWHLVPTPTKQTVVSCGSLISINSKRRSHFLNKRLNSEKTLRVHKILWPRFFPKNNIIISINTSTSCRIKFHAFWKTPFLSKQQSEWYCWLLYLCLLIACVQTWEVHYNTTLLYTFSIIWTVIMSQTQVIE